jgi:hypothetical protein
MVIKCHHWKICLFFPLFPKSNVRQVTVRLMPLPFALSYVYFLSFSYMKNGSLHIIIVLCLGYLMGNSVAELLVCWRA